MCPQCFEILKIIKFNVKIPFAVCLQFFYKNEKMQTGNISPIF